METDEGHHRTPLAEVEHYLVQPQTLHSQTAQVQNSPSQPLHWQASLADVAAVTLSFATQQDLASETAGAVAARTHPQLPHSQTSQVQNSPLQFGQWQSTQPQDAFPCGEPPVGVADAKAYVSPSDAARSSPRTEYRLNMVFLTELKG